MARFTKDQMRDELRTIFLFEAAHITRGAGRAAAEAFIGFTPEGLWGARVFLPEDYLKADPMKVDLSRFAISETFDLAYDFAFRPSKSNFLNDGSNELIAFMHGIPRGAGGSGYGGITTHPFMTPEGCCQIVADAAFARWKLEGAEPKDFGNVGGISFSTRELGLLANMSEGAVRNALADKSENGLSAIPGEKPVKVSRDEARRWLHGRRGFLKAPGRPRDDAFVREQLAAVRTVRELSNFLSGHLSGYDDLYWQEQDDGIYDWHEKVDAWENGKIPTDLNEIRAFARAIDVDVPLFVGKVYEVIERREAAVQGGQS